MHKIIAGCLAALLCAGAQAQVYKWVDSQGRTHYDQKPPENVKSKEVQMHDTSTSAGSGPSNGADWQEKERAFKQRQVDRQKADAKADSDRQKKEALVAKCQAARNNIQNLRNANRVFDTGANGDRQYLDDDQRAARVAQREAEYNQNCSN